MYYLTFPFRFPRQISRNPRLFPAQAWRAKKYTICDCPGQDRIVAYAARSAPPPGGPERVRTGPMREILGQQAAGAPVWIVARAGDARAGSLAREIGSVFTDSGWQVKALETTHIRVRPGIFLFIAQAEWPTYVDTIRRALEAAGLGPTVGSDYESYAAEMRRANPSWEGFTFATGQTHWLVIGRVD